MNSLRVIAVVAATFCGLTAQAQQAPANQQLSPEQRVAVLKEGLQTSKAQMRNYEWVETTTISKDGEEKNRSQNTVYYSLDGALQKKPIGGESAESGGPRGPVRKRVAEGKVEDLQEYMRQAVALVQSYVPPDPNRIQQTMAGGKFSVNMVEPGKRARLEFRDYQKAGDLLGVEVDMATNKLLGMSVSSYLETPDDPVALDVKMGALPDGTTYTATTRLDAKAEGIVVNVANSGHRKSQQ